MNKYRTLCAFMLMAIGACTVGPNYKAPEIIIPDSFKEAPPGWKIAQPQESCPRGAWWEIFKEPKLNELEFQLNNANQTLKAAIEQYNQARALVLEARSAYFPLVTGSYSVTKQKQSISNVQVANVSNGTTPSSVVSNGRPFNILNLTLDATWEPDLWGAVRRNVESAVATAQSDAAFVVLTKLLAEASLAMWYFEYRGLDANQVLLDDTVNDYKKILQITINRYRQGTVSRLEILQAQSALETAQAAAVDNGIERAIYEHAIAVLIGVPPSIFTLPPHPLAPKNIFIPVEVPSQWLERRPDVAQSERLVASANAQIGVAISAFYPVLTLTGINGYQADALRRLFRPASQFWSIAGQLAQTLFDGGLRGAKVDAAKAAYEQAVANYRQTVLTAFQDVEDQLATLRILEREEKIQYEAVVNAEKALKIIINRYHAGTAQLSDVLTQEIVTFNARQTAITVTTRRMVAAALLVKALGGGWDVDQLPNYGCCTCSKPEPWPRYLPEPLTLFSLPLFEYLN